MMIVMIGLVDEDVIWSTAVDDSEGCDWTLLWGSELYCNVQWQSYELLISRSENYEYVILYSPIPLQRHYCSNSAMYLSCTGPSISSSSTHRIKDRTFFVDSPTDDSMRLHASQYYYLIANFLIFPTSSTVNHLHRVRQVKIL